MKQKLIDFLKKRETIVALISLVVFGVLLAVDLVTKAWAESTNVRQSAFFLGIVRFFLTKNTGMAFSWFDDNDAAMTVVTIFTVVLIVAGIIAGYVPAYRAAQLKTIDALRYNK